MEQKAIYKFQNICKYFPGVKALDDVSFDIMEGEINATDEYHIRRLPALIGQPGV